MVNYEKKIIIRDSTLREGLDVPQVSFTFKTRLKIARLLSHANVPELEIVAPARVLKDLEFAKLLRKEKLPAKISGLIYATSPNYKEEIKASSGLLDRFDILMPVSLKRRPYQVKEKIKTLLEALNYSLRYARDLGVGFPHATQASIDFLLKIGKLAQENGAKRITLYDTNGSSDPFKVYDLIRRNKKIIGAPLFFHGHNDLGMATANSLAAVYAGADGLDTTINGLGDRAGNAAFEQVILVLLLRGFSTGAKIKSLRKLSKFVEKESKVKVSKLSVVVGDYVFSHKSAGHLEDLGLFEAFDPKLTGQCRHFVRK